MALHIESGDDRGRCVLRLAGELDAAAAEHLHTTIAHHQGEAAAHRRGEAAEALLILDLGAVGFIDSGGLRSLLQLHITHQRGGGPSGWPTLRPAQPMDRPWHRSPTRSPPTATPS